MYFDIDPQNGNGSDIGFEITNGRAFVAGVDGYAPVATSFANGANGSIEFSIPNSYFTAPISGLEANYSGGQQFATTGSDVTLRLSQSLGYTVAGGATFGPNRLGSVEIGGEASPVSAAPEPSAWALMLGGVAFLGAMLRVQRARRREDEVSGLATT